MSTHPEPLVQIAKHDRVASITLNRPDKRNALNDAMLREFLHAVGHVEADAEIRVLIVRGSGKSFCSGVDLSEKLAGRDAGGAVDYDLLLQAFARLEHYPNPTIAVLQGTSLAGGWELALHCDIRFAAPDAKFGMPLVRLGLVAPYAAQLRLVQLAGPAAAIDLLLSASLIDGARAHDLGLVTHLADARLLDSSAMDYAHRLAGLAPLAVRETKRVLAHILSAQHPATHEEFDNARRRVTASHDTEEGLRAFLERRPPVFKGI